METSNFFIIIYLIAPLNVSSMYFCSGLKTFQNLSPTLVLADENVLTRFAEVKGMNIKWELVGWAWCCTWMIELEMEKCFSGVWKVLWVVKNPTKQPTNNSDLRNSGKEENYFLPPLLFCVFSSQAGCGWTVWKAKFPALPYKSTLVICEGWTGQSTAVFWRVDGWFFS